MLISEALVTVRTSLIVRLIIELEPGHVPRNVKPQLFTVRDETVRFLLDHSLLEIFERQLDREAVQDLADRHEALRVHLEASVELCFLHLHFLRVLLNLALLLHLELGRGNVHEVQVLISLLREPFSHLKDSRGARVQVEGDFFFVDVQRSEVKVADAAILDHDYYWILLIKIPARAHQFILNLIDYAGAPDAHVYRVEIGVAELQINPKRRCSTLRLESDRAPDVQNDANKVDPCAFVHHADVADRYVLDAALADGFANYVAPVFDRT